MSYGTPLLSRAQTGLRPPKWVNGPPSNPTALTGHYVGHTPWPDFANAKHDRCPSLWRAFQALHMDRENGADIFYSSAVCPHGFRLEGRGPGVKQGANGTNEGNNKSYTVLYIAGDDDPLTDLAKLALLDEAERYGMPFRWQHWDWYATACCGRPFGEWIDAGCPAPDGVTPPAPIDPILPPEAPMALLLDTVNGEDRIEQISLDPKGTLLQSWQERKHDKNSFTEFQTIGQRQSYPFVSATISTQKSGNCVITGLGAFGQREQRFSIPQASGGYGWSDWYPVG